MVSGELCRILRHEGIQVIGVILDDLLLRGPCAEGASGLTRKWEKAKHIMSDLGLPSN